VSGGANQGLLTFRVRFILMDHAAAIAKAFPVTLGLEGRFSPSAILTFFLHIWYLQHKINELVDESRAWNHPAHPEAGLAVPEKL
jgi:hypothetical protein